MARSTQQSITLTREEIQQEVRQAEVNWFNQALYFVGEGNIGQSLTEIIIDRIDARLNPPKSA